MNIRFTLFLSLLFYCQPVFPQVPVASGFFTSEAAGVSHKGTTYLLLKEFAPSNKEREDDLRKGGQLTYLDLPLEAAGVSMFGDGFKSVLFCIDGSGKIVWKRELGVSNRSWADGIAVDAAGMVYVGEKDSTRVRIRKLNGNGDVLWTSTIDSLGIANRIFADTSNFISILASRTVLRQVIDGDEMTMEEVSLYRTIRLGREKGELQSDVFNEQLTFACAEGFSEPMLNEHRVNYMFKEDSLYLHLNDRNQVMNVNEKDLDGFKIVDMTGSAGQVYLLAQSVRGRDFRLLLDRFRPDQQIRKMYDMVLDEDIGNTFMCENELNGVSVFLCGSGQMKVLKFDSSLGLVWNKTVDIGRIGFMKASAVIMNDDGSYGIAYVVLDGMARHVRFVKLSSDGRLHNG